MEPGFSKANSNNLPKIDAVMLGQFFASNTDFCSSEFRNVKTSMEVKQNYKRKDYVSWEDYFMAIACLAAKRSKDPSSQVGACIVDSDKKIVGVGYNGMPTGCSDDEFPWGKNTEDPLDNKLTFVCHAEVNAIVNRNSANVKGCTIYVGLFPCNECAKLIIQSGITKVIYLSDKHAHKAGTKASKKMFDAVNIQYEQHKPKLDQIVINFSDIDWNNSSPSKEL